MFRNPATSEEPNKQLVEEPLQPISRGSSEGMYIHETLGNSRTTRGTNEDLKTQPEIVDIPGQSS